MKKICIFVGARPNFIKVAPLIWAMDSTSEIDYSLVYAGRADDPTLEDSLFSDLQIKRPDVCLGVDCESLNELTGRVMQEFENYLKSTPTDIVIVVDDLASTMAAAIVTKKEGLTLAHLVAGTRSFDIRMPKEINRLVIDGLSDILFTAGTPSQATVSREGAEMSKVFNVGNILLDTLRRNKSRFSRPDFLEEVGDYLVFTLNRKALLADEDNLRMMLASLTDAAGDVPIFAPLRGRAKQLVQQMSSNIRVVEPLGYLEFGWLTSNALGIITDSGNVAEEATFNGIPCITLNSYTEHPETVSVGTNVLVGENADLLREETAKMVSKSWKEAHIPDRWDGRTADRIVSILSTY